MGNLARSAQSADTIPTMRNRVNRAGYCHRGSTTLLLGLAALVVAAIPSPGQSATPAPAGTPAAVDTVRQSNPHFTAVSRLHRDARWDPVPIVPGTSRVEYVLLRPKVAAPERTPVAVKTTQVAQARKPVSAQRVTTKPKAAVSPAPKAPAAASGTPSSATALPSWRRRPIMGDGSTPGELLAAAHRLLGVQESLGGRSFLQHALLVAALDVEVGDPDDRFEPQALRALRASNSILTDESPRAGDLAFLRTGSGGLLRAAIVEAIDRQGRVWLIGEVAGTVERFELQDGAKLVAYGRP